MGLGERLREYYLVCPGTTTHLGRHRSRPEGSCCRLWLSAQTPKIRSPRSQSALL